MKRKNDYDSAYLTTNMLFPSVRNYLDRGINIESSGVFGQNSDLDEKLRKVSAIHDQCLTKAFAIRSEWEEVRWPNLSKNKKETELLELKKRRDTEIYNSLEKCKPGKGYALYKNSAITTLYNNCFEVLFSQYDYAVNNKIKPGDKNFKSWHDNANHILEDKCSLSRASIEPVLTEEKALSDKVY